MAGDWIPLRVDIADDPAVISIAGTLGMDEFAVVGRLHHLWSWANRQLDSGNACGVTEKWIDRYVSASGFAQAMVGAGWLTPKDGGFEFPKFDRWNSQGAKRRVLTSRRVALHRNAERNATNVTTALTREEKRREEENTPLTPLRGEVRGAKPKADSLALTDPRFLRFWAAYPRKEKKNSAAKAFAKINPTPELFETILAAVASQQQSGCLEPRTAADGRSVVPHPASWLNDLRWEDSPSSARVNGKPAKPITTFADLNAKYAEGGVS